jgi:hypothetical protein
MARNSEGSARRQVGELEGRSTCASRAEIARQGIGLVDDLYVAIDPCRMTLQWWVRQSPLRGTAMGVLIRFSDPASPARATRQAA